MASSIGTRIAELRGKRTQTDLASAMRKRGFGTTQTTVSRWESGQAPRGIVLPALAAELGVTVDELLGPADEEEESRAVPNLLEDLYAQLGAALGKVSVGA